MAQTTELVTKMYTKIRLKKFTYKIYQIARKHILHFNAQLTTL
jgi:hypothetical protein